MSPVAISADKRFHRAHVKPSRKRSRLKTISVPLVKGGLIAAFIVLLIYRGGAVLAEAPLLKIDHIVVSGNHRLATADVLSILGGLRGENIVLSDLDAWREHLVMSPWVRDATFRRSLPSTVEVVVAEREPLGIGRQKGQLFLVDERGAVIDNYGPQYADLDLPIIDGLTIGSSAGDADAHRGELAARVIQAIRTKPGLAKRLSQVDVTDQHNAAVILNGDQAVIYVGDDRFVPRLESYLDLASTLRARVAAIDYVDLRFDDRIYVRPTKASKSAGSDRGSDAKRQARATAKRP
ncbi:MAG TPA: FtsQ-type POTRA domain-containing protein [Vicinamibacterales bacterium]